VSRHEASFGHITVIPS